MTLLGVLALLLVLVVLAGVVLLVMVGRKPEPHQHPGASPSHEAQAHYDAMQRGAENQRNNSSGIQHD